MKKLITLLFALAIFFSANAQILDEGFEEGALPAGWSWSYVLGTLDWAYQNGGHDGFPASAHTGNYNAVLYNSTTSMTILVTPELDLSVGVCLLKFWHTQDYWGSDADQLDVYYKEGAAGTWNILATYDYEIVNWTEETIALPTTSSEVYIGFTGTTGYGYGVCLDDVLVELATPVFAVNPESHDYGTYILYDPVVLQDFVVSNADAGTLTIASSDDVVLSGANAAMYTLTTNETYPINLAAAETATFTVEYTPSEAGTHTASLDITDNTTKAVHNIPLTGECVDPTLIPPFTEDFEPTYDDIEYWIEFKGELADPTVTSENTSFWMNDGFGNIGSDGCAKLNIFGTSIIEWVATPPVNMGTGTTNYQLEFDLALTDYNNQDPGTLGTDDIFAVVISTDNGLTWSSANVLQQWGSGDAISNTSDHIIIPLTGYSGIVKIGFYGESTFDNEDNDLFVDNVSVTEIPSAANDILSYSFPEQAGAATIDDVTHTVDIEVIPGTDITALVATFTLSTGATAAVGPTTQVSGITPNDFTSPVTYTVTAQDGITTQDWIVSLSLNPTFTVTFNVDDGTNAVDGAEILINNNTLTTAGGGIATINLVNGDYPYTVTATGFEDYTGHSVTVENAAITEIVHLNPTDVNELPANEISICSNPSNGVFNINVTETFNLKVIDITGKVVKTQVLDNNTNTVNVFEKGIYILKLTNEKTSVMHRIIVN